MAARQRRGYDAHPSTLERKAKAKDALWAMITGVPGLAVMITEHKLDRAGLDDLLNHWSAVGDLWIGTQYVSVSALTHPKTLRYALSKRGAVNGIEWASTLAGMIKARDYWE